MESENEKKARQYWTKGKGNITKKKVEKFIKNHLKHRIHGSGWFTDKFDHVAEVASGIYKKIEGINDKLKSW